MVSKLGPMHRSCAARNPASRSAASISLGGDASIARPSQVKKPTRAAPSRRCAARAPSISVGFLIALGNWQGSTPTETGISAAFSRSTTQAGVFCGSRRTGLPSPFSRSSAGPNRSGGLAVTLLPRWARVSGDSLRSSMNSSTWPSWFRMAKLSGKGALGTSPPRMFRSQAIESGWVSTVAPAPHSDNAAPMWARFSSEATPA